MFLNFPRSTLFTFKKQTFSVSRVKSFKMDEYRAELDFIFSQYQLERSHYTASVNDNLDSLHHRYHLI